MPEINRLLGLQHPTDTDKTKLNEYLTKLCSKHTIYREKEKLLESVGSLSQFLEADDRQKIAQFEAVAFPDKSEQGKMNLVIAGANERKQKALDCIRAYEDKLKIIFVGKHGAHPIFLKEKQSILDQVKKTTPNPPAELNGKIQELLHAFNTVECLPKECRNILDASKGVDQVMEKTLELIKKSVVKKKMNYAPVFWKNLTKMSSSRMDGQHLEHLLKSSEMHSRYTVGRKNLW